MNSLTDTLKQLEDKLKAQSLLYKQEIKEIEIFKEFISNDDDQLAMWENAESQIKSVCGADVKNGELTFQCFTCAPDPHHMYCYKCFDPQLHLNHKCIIKHNIGGACDCGDEQTIVPSGFCSKHQGVSKFDQNFELSKIPTPLKQNIENFIKALCLVYLQLVKRINSEHEMFNVRILRLYHLSEKWLITPFKEVIDSEYNIEEYYRIFQQALYLYSILFKMCQWLTESRLSFIILLSQIFQQKLTPYSEQTIFEDIIETQVLIESQGPQPAIKIESLLFRFYADYSFKQFIQICYIKKYKSMWLNTKQKVTKLDKMIDDYHYKLQTIPNLQFARAQHEILVKMSQNVKNYIQEYKYSTEYVHVLNIAEIHEQHTQYVAEQLQEIFLNHRYMSNVYDQIRNLQDIIHSHTPILSLSQLQYSVVFKLRYDYSFFYKIGFKQLQQIPENYYQELLFGNISRQFIKDFRYQDFTISAFINCFSQIKPIHIDIQEENLTIWQQDLLDAAYLLICQGQAIQAIEIGIQKLFNCQFSNKQFQENMTKLLFIQCYSILKSKSKFISIDQQLNEAYNKYIENKNLKQEEQFDRLSKIYLILIKSLTVIERIFTFFLAQLYCLKDFSSGKEFQSYILEILQEDKQQFKIILYEILSKCSQVYTSIQFCQLELLEQIYLGLKDQQETIILESYDSTFLRFYLFLFENEGFQDLIQIMQNRKIPIQGGIHKLLCCMLLRMFSSDLDMYNVCCSTQKVLPKDLKLSLAKALQNFYNLSTFLHYTEIENKLRRMGIQICSNLPDHVLQICEVDQALKQLKLKPEYRVIYDPAIFNINTSMNSQIVEKLIEQNKSENEIHLGNGITWDVELFNTQNYRTILYNLLKQYCQRQYIQINIGLLNTEGFALIQAYQLLYIQIVAAKHFRYDELIIDIPSILDQLEEIEKKTQRKDDLQRIQVLIQEINKIKTDVEPVPQKQSTDIKANLKNKKNQYKEKYNKLQKSEFISNMLESNNIVENNYENNNEQVCSSCKLPLSQQHSVALILLIQKPQTTNLSISSQQNIEFFNNKDFNLLDIGIANCKHYFHYICLIERFESDQQYRRQNAPDWVKIGCPVCKLPCTITLPIQKQMTALDVESFNQDLQLFVSKKTAEKLFEDQIIAQTTLVQTYYNIFFDLLVSLFQNPSDYVRDQKHIVFNQFLQMLQLTNVEEAKAKIKENFKFQADNNFILSILILIQNHVVLEKNLDLLKIEVMQICIQYEIAIDVCKQIALSFEVKEEQCSQLLQSSQKLQCIDNSNQISIINQKQLEAQIINILGQNFNEFYCRYFNQKCFYCQFYNKDQRYGGFSMCLLCSKSFCIYSCKKSLSLGNLNDHAVKEHNGISIYVNLKNGYVTLLCSPISIQYYKCLFYNQLGQTIDLENSNQDWNSFNLDYQKVKEIAQIVLTNSYQTIIRNLEVKQHQLDLEGLL